MNTRKVYIAQKTDCSGLWETSDWLSGIQISIHNSEQEAIDNAIANGYVIH